MSSQQPEKAPSQVTREQYFEEHRRGVMELFQLDPKVQIRLSALSEAPYLLEYNNFAVKGILKDVHINILGKGFDPTECEDPEVLGSVLYWGLKTNHPDITPEQVDRAISYRHMLYYMECLRIALHLYMPDMSGFKLSDEDEAAIKKAAEEAAKTAAVDPTRKPIPIG